MEQGAVPTTEQRTVIDEAHIRSLQSVLHMLAGRSIPDTPETAQEYEVQEFPLEDQRRRITPLTESEIETLGIKLPGDPTRLEDDRSYILLGRHGEVSTFMSIGASHRRHFIQELLDHYHETGDVFPKERYLPRTIEAWIKKLSTYFEMLDEVMSDREINHFKYAYHKLLIPHIVLNYICFKLVENGTVSVDDEVFRVMRKQEALELMRAMLYESIDPASDLEKYKPPLWKGADLAEEMKGELITFFHARFQQSLKNMLRAVYQGEIMNYSNFNYYTSFGVKLERSGLSHIQFDAAKESGLLADSDEKGLAAMRALRERQFIQQDLEAALSASEKLAEQVDLLSLPDPVLIQRLVGEDHPLVFIPSDTQRAFITAREMKKRLSEARFNEIRIATRLSTTTGYAALTYIAGEEYPNYALTAGLLGKSWGLSSPQTLPQAFNAVVSDVDNRAYAYFIEIIKSMVTSEYTEAGYFITHKEFLNFLGRYVGLDIDFAKIHDHLIVLRVPKIEESNVRVVQAFHLDNEGKVLHRKDLWYRVEEIL